MHYIAQSAIVTVPSLLVTITPPLQAAAVTSIFSHPLPYVKKLILWA